MLSERLSFRSVLTEYQSGMTLFCIAVVVNFVLCPPLSRFVTGEQYREERGIKRVTDVPPEDVIPDKYADRPKKVRFLIDYKDPISAATVVARLTVLTIKVTGLPSIHLVEDNSPFVQLKCGSFRFATEINALAGQALRTILFSPVVAS